MTKAECADNYVVKYWPKRYPNDYELSEVTTELEVRIVVEAGTEYRLQVVAREDRGGEYRRS